MSDLRIEAFIPSKISTADRSRHERAQETKKPRQRLVFFRCISFWYTMVVPVVGLEPTRCRQQRILSPPRLPIPTHRQEFSSKITTPEIGGHFGGQTSKIKDIQFSKAQINRAVPASEREMTHWILSPSRLPIPSFRRKLYSIIIQRAMQHKLRTQTPHGSAAYAPPQRHE